MRPPPRRCHLCSRWQRLLCPSRPGRRLLRAFREGAGLLGPHCARESRLSSRHSIMNDGGGCGQQLVMRQKIYFRDYREHSLEYADVYPDIRAGLLRSIMRNASARGILTIRHGTLLPRLDAWLLPVRGRAGPPAAELADRRGPPPECAVARPARRAGLTHNSFLTVFSARNMRSAICRFVSPSPTNSRTRFSWSVSADSRSAVAI